MNFSVSVSETAQTDLESLDAKQCEVILKKIKKAAENPQHFLERLSGYTLYKLRCGEYRAIIRMDTANSLMWVVMVDHRKNVYERFRRFMK